MRLARRDYLKGKRADAKGVGGVVIHGGPSALAAGAHYRFLDLGGAAGNGGQECAAGLGLVHFNRPDFKLLRDFLYFGKQPEQGPDAVGRDGPAAPTADKGRGKDDDAWPFLQDEFSDDAVGMAHGDPHLPGTTIEPTAPGADFNVRSESRPAKIKAGIKR